MTPGPAAIRPVYEHPWFVRFLHWSNAMAVAVMVASGLQIFMAFPSFGPKIPERDLLDAVPEVMTLGGWLGGALQWHFTFMWVFAIGGVCYLVLQIVSGHGSTLWFTSRDVTGVWPMVRHYVWRDPTPPQTAQYNALQKLAYTTAVLLGVLLVWTGAVMYKPVQFSLIGRPLGGYHAARLLHALAMCGLLAFIPGHLLMVALHGWDNVQSMVTGWKYRPDYTPARSVQADGARLIDGDRSTPS